MDPMNIINPILSVGGLGVVFGACLGIASEVFKVDEDPRIGQILEVLPGANCGGCGFPGCAGCASAIASGKAPLNACPVGGGPVAEKVGAIMGVEASTAEPVAAFVKCGGDCDKAKVKYDYEGISDCNMAVQLAGQGAKSCTYGCLGLGSCVKVCKFDAIHVVNGVAVVDKDKCVACGKCVEACPKHIIQLLPAKKKVKVQCSSKEIGRNVMPVCTAGCIACKICEKNCPFDAIHVIDNLATIDYDKCRACGICANKCPKGVLTGKKPAPPKPAAPVAKPAAAAAPAAPKAEAPAAEAPKAEAPKA